MVKTDKPKKKKTTKKKPKPKKETCGCDEHGFLMDVINNAEDVTEFDRKATELLELAQRDGEKALILYLPSQHKEGVMFKGVNLGPEVRMKMFLAMCSSIESLSREVFVIMMHDILTATVQDMYEKGEEIPEEIKIKAIPEEDGKDDGMYA